MSESPVLSAPHSAKARWRAALDLIGLALLALYLVGFAPRNATLQWDGRTYLHAARAALAGLDPYRLADLEKIAGYHRVSLPFLYPPVALLPFLPLARLETASALALWLGFKLALFAALVVLWKRLAMKVEWLPLGLVAVFGSNGSALWDLRAGNVGILEAALVWSGLAALIAGRRVWFASLIVAAACFKLVPSVYLLLLLVPLRGARPGPKTMLVSLAALALLVWGPFAFPPASHWSGFLGNVGEGVPLGDANPSLLAMTLNFARAASPDARFSMALALAAWLSILALTLWASARWLGQAWREGDARRWAFAAVWLATLFAPRPMAYGFVAFAPAPLFLAPPRFANPPGRLLLALAIAAQGLSRAASIESDSVLLRYAPSLLALGFWLLVVRAPEPKPAA
jgi:hypothetical protein